MYMHVCVYIYIYIHVYIYIYHSLIYIYIYNNISLSLYIYIYRYICIYRPASLARAADPRGELSDRVERDNRVPDKRGLGPGRGDIQPVSIAVAANPDADAGVS